MSLRPPAARLVSRGGAAGKGRCGVMARVAVRESMTLAGRAERARVARAFVSEVLGPGHPYGDVAVLLDSGPGRSAELADRLAGFANLSPWRTVS